MATYKAIVHLKNSNETKTININANAPDDAGGKAIELILAKIYSRKYYGEKIDSLELYDKNGRKCALDTKILLAVQIWNMRR